MRTLRSICEQLNPKTSDELAIAQVVALKKRVPILYAVLAVNTFLLSATHYPYATSLQTVYIPTVFIVVMVYRGLHWYSIDLSSLSPQEARGKVKQISVLSSLFSLVLLLWSATIYESSPTLGRAGQISAHGQAVLYVGLTLMCCISLLMHARVASVLTTLLVVPPFCLLMIWRGSLVEVAVAVNLALVAIAMLYVMTIFARDFRQLVDSKSELNRMHEHQKRLAATDPLTGLNNRRHFYQALDDISNRRKPFAIAMVDLDRFKQVNDAHGHAIGDEVLREIAHRIANIGQDAISTARVGGDEFAVLFTRMETAELFRIGTQIVEACRVPVMVQNLMVTVGASVGFNEVELSELDEPPSIHVERADYALYHVKQSGRGYVERFTPAHEQAIRRAGIVEQALKAADLDDELTVLYQPIVLANDLRLNGFEALVRWHNPTLGSVLPGEFIPIAERCGMIHEITRTVFRKSLKQLARWPDHLRLKVNLSPYDLASSEQMIALLAILERVKVNGKRLTFEVTETAFSDNIAAIRDSITLLRSTGASIAIDDFGTGYSSLSSIHHIRPDLIKIDRSFIVRLDDGGSGHALVKTIIEMCRNLGTRSLGEGVEHADQAYLLTQLGCDELQGYWFSKPVSARQAYAMTRDDIAVADNVTAGKSSNGSTSH